MAFMYRDMWHTFHEYILRICIMAGWIAEMLFMPILLCNGQNIAEYDAYWLMDVTIINLWGPHFTSVFSIFSVMAGWIAEILFMLFFAYTAV